MINLFRALTIRFSRSRVMMIIGDTRMEIIISGGIKIVIINGDNATNSNEASIFNNLL